MPTHQGTKCPVGQNSARPGTGRNGELNQPPAPLNLEERGVSGTVCRRCQAFFEHREGKTPGRGGQRGQETRAERRAGRPAPSAVEARDESSTTQRTTMSETELLGIFLSARKLRSRRVLPERAMRATGRQRHTAQLRTFGTSGTDVHLKHNTGRRKLRFP